VMAITRGIGPMYPAMGPFGLAPRTRVDAPFTCPGDQRPGG
jgi:hypothetical protein